MYQITLKMARINCDLTVEEAAQKAGITPRRLRKWEKDSSLAELLPIAKLLQVYGLSFNHIHFGTEEEVIANLINAMTKGA